MPGDRARPVREAPDGLQHLLAGSKWEPDDIRDDLQEHVAAKLGEADGVLIIDDTGFIKKGTTSGGVQRQYSGTALRTENCQIGVFAAYAYASAYASACGRALVDRELGGTAELGPLSGRNRMPGVKPHKRRSAQ